MEAPGLLPGGTASAGVGVGSVAHLEIQSRLPISQHVRCVAPSRPLPGRSQVQSACSSRAPAMPQPSLTLGGRAFLRSPVGADFYLSFRSSPPPRACLTPIPDPDPLRFHSRGFPTVHAALQGTWSGPRTSLEAPAVGGACSLLSGLAGASPIFDEQTTPAAYLALCRGRQCGQVPSETELYPPPPGFLVWQWRSCPQMPALAGAIFAQRGAEKPVSGLPGQAGELGLGRERVRAPAPASVLHYQPRPLEVSAAPRSLLPERDRKGTGALNAPLRSRGDPARGCSVGGVQPEV